MRNITLLFLIYFSITGFAQESNNSNSFIDARNNLQYSSAKIGNDFWMTENLNVTTFRNGDKINFASSLTEWQAYSEKGEPVYCYPSFLEENAKTYGLIYNWYAVNDSRGLAPDGWHVPNQDEWKAMLNFAGGMNYAGPKIKHPEHWKTDVGASILTNTTTFSALPAGNIYLDAYLKPKMHLVGTTSGNMFADFWTTITNAETALLYHVSSSDKVSGGYSSKKVGCSIRCVKGSDGFAPSSSSSNVSTQPDENSFIGTFVKIENDEYYHLIFVDEKGQEWDFGDGENNLGDFNFGEEETNTTLVGKKFKIVWKELMVEMYDGEGNLKEFNAPSIINITLLE